MKNAKTKHKKKKKTFFFSLSLGNDTNFQFYIRTIISQARELIDGQPGNDNLTMATTQASITIHDVNDSPPTFNKKNYYISLTENTPVGTPLPIDIHVNDPDVVSKLN